MIEKTLKTRAILYSRCSTTDKRQNTELQSQELRRYAEAYGWAYDEVSEYSSGFKINCQPELDKVLEKIRLKQYDVILVHSIDRFSRQHPKKTSVLLNRIVYDYGCRFIALQQGIDSDNELTWNCTTGMFIYFANLFSQNLSEKIRAGIESKKEKGTYKGGRPKKNGKINIPEVKRLYADTSSLRKTAAAYNQTRYKDNRISYQYVSRVLSGAI